MKYNEILKAVLFMNDVENQGIIEIPTEEEKDFDTLLDTLEAIFGEIYEEESLGVETIEWGKKYFWSKNPLCSEDTLRNKNPEQNCYPVPCILCLAANGDEIYIYDIED